MSRVSDEITGRRAGDVREPAPPIDERSTAEPLLAQADVDELVGYADEGRPEPDGLRAMLEASAVAREPMPMLDTVFERLVRSGSAAMRTMFLTDAELVLDRVDTMRFGDFVDDLALPAQLLAFHAAEWGGGGLIAMAPGADHMVLDRFLGGGGGGRARPSSRPPTAIEAELLSRFAACLLKEVERSFSQVSPVTFAMSGLESNPRAVETARPSAAILVARLQLRLDGRTAKLDLVLPHATLEPIRPLLESRFTGERLGRDEVWSRHLATQVWRADIQADALLHEVRLPLGRVLDLAIGDTLMFELKPSDLVEIRSGGLLLTRGRMGRVDGRIAIQVADELRAVPAASGARRAGAGRFVG